MPRATHLATRAMHLASLARHRARRATRLAQRAAPLASPCAAQNRAQLTAPRAGALPVSALRVLATALALMLPLTAARVFAQAAAPAAPSSAPMPAAAAASSPTGDTLVLTLAAALARAEQANPALQARLAQRAAAEGAQRDAGALLHNNPQLAIEQRRRDVPIAGLPGERRREWAASLSQTFETGGQAAHRRSAADAARAALQWEIDDARRQLRADVAQQFTRVLALQQRERVEGEAVALIERAAAAVSKRRALGEDTRLDANVATVEAQRAQNQWAQTQEQLAAARAEWAAQLQLPPGVVPQAAGTFDAPGPVGDAAPWRAQVADQPRLKALAAREDSARARLALERAARTPDLTVSVSTGREGAADARERLTTVGVSLPLPLFTRNAAGIGAATTELDQARLAREAAERDAQAQVQALWWRQRSLEARVQRLQQQVLPALADNDRLAEKSQRAGQIGVLELIVVNRQTLDARRELIDALAEARLNYLALELAAGREPAAAGQ